MDPSFQLMTVKATDSRKRKEDDRKKLDLAKQLELVSEMYGKIATKYCLLSSKLVYFDID